MLSESTFRPLFRSRDSEDEIQSSLPSGELRSHSRRVSSNSDHDPAPDVIEEPLVHSRKRQKKRASGFFTVLHLWLFEILSLLLSILVIVAIIISLSLFNGQPLPSFPLGITLNALISFLATLSKAAMLTTVTGCVSQLKWHWFHRPHRLIDFEIFDQVSRGPWGAMRMMLSFKFFKLANLSALVILVALLVDPFMQQIIAYPATSSNIDGASIAKAQVYEGDSDAANNLGGVQIGPAYGMKSAIYSGLFNPEDSSDVVVSCPTGNCTLPLFDSLAFCSKCSNATDQTTLSHVHNFTSHQFTWNASNLTWILPGSTAIDMTIYYGEYSGEGYSLTNGVAVISSTSVPADMSSKVLDVPNPLVSLALLQFPEVNAAGYQGVYWNATPLAWQCALYLCLNTYNVSVTNSRVNSSLVSSWYPTDAPPSSEAPSTQQGELPYLTLQRPSNSLVTTGNGSFWAAGYTLSVLSQYLSHTLNGSMQSSTSEVGSGTFVPDLMQVLNITSDIPRLFDGLATTMTNYLRQNPPTDGVNAEDNHVQGTAVRLESFVSVRWAWMALPISLLLAAAVLLVWTMLVTARGDMPVWKTNILATLFVAAGTDRTEGSAVDGGSEGIYRAVREGAGTEALVGAATGVRVSIRRDENRLVRLKAERGVEQGIRLKDMKMGRK